MENEPTVKLASNAMTTLEDTMERLGIPPEAADTAVKNNIIRLINSASAWIETITGRKFGKATYTHRYVAPGAQELVLTQYPIRAVEYVRDTENGVDIAPGSYDFTMTGDVGVLYRDEGWVFRGYVGGLANDYIAPRRYLEVKFTAGYVLPKDATEDEPSDLPEDIVAIVWGSRNRSSPSCGTALRALRRSPSPTCRGPLTRNPAPPGWRPWPTT